MKTDLSRRTFMILLGASAAAAAARRPAKSISAKPRTAIPPLHMPTDRHLYPPARPKTAAITYLNTEHPTPNIES